MKRQRISLGLSLLALWIQGCNLTTGGRRIVFQAAAAGPDLDPAQIPTFLNRLDYEVTLSRAILHVGAIYLNSNSSISTADDQYGCYGGGVEVGQVLGGLDIDLLSPEPQPFPVLGEGTQRQARAAAVWLTGTQRVDAFDDRQVILNVAGVAVKADQRYPFQGSITIGANRVIPSPDPATPGVNPLCKQRIVVVAPLRIDPPLTDGGLLLLRVDPNDLFLNTDFSAIPLRPGSGTCPPPLRCFSDGIETIADLLLYASLRDGNTYHFFWQPAGGGN